MAIPTLTANSPSVGSFAWTAFTIRYNGVSYAVAASSTTQKFVWWRYLNGTPQLEAGEFIPDGFQVTGNAQVNPSAEGSLVGGLPVGWGYTGWNSATPQANTTVDNAFSVLGTQSIKLTTDGTAVGNSAQVGGSVITSLWSGSSNVAVAAGQIIYAQVWVRGSAAMAGGTYLRMRNNNSGGEFYGTGAVENQYTGTSWTRVAGYFTVPAGCTSITPFVLLYAPHAAVGAGKSLWVDQMVVSRFDPTPLGDDDLVLFGNKNGTPINLQTASVVDGGLIVSGSILADQLSANSVTAEKILAGSVDTNKLSAAAVTADKMAANSVTADKIAANSIAADKLIANSVTADKLATDLLLASTIKTADTGSRVIFDQAGIKLYAADDSVQANLPTSPDDKLFFKAKLETDDFVSSDAVFQDTVKFDLSSVSTASNSIKQTATVAPLATPGYDKVPSFTTGSSSENGLCWDGTDYVTLSRYYNPNVPSLRAQVNVVNPTTGASSTIGITDFNDGSGTTATGTTYSGLTYIGGKYYTLYWRYNSSNGVYVSAGVIEFTIDKVAKTITNTSWSWWLKPSGTPTSNAQYYLFTWGSPENGPVALGSDGTNLLVAVTDYAAGNIKMGTCNPTGTRTFSASTTVTYPVAGMNTSNTSVQSIQRGNFDIGSQHTMLGLQYVTTPGNDGLARLYAYSGTSGTTRVSAQDFIVASGSIYFTSVYVGNSTTSWAVWSGSGKQIHTLYPGVTAGYKTVRYTYTNTAKSYESTASPQANALIYKGQNIRVNSPTMPNTYALLDPTDNPTGIKIYGAQGVNQASTACKYYAASSTSPNSVLIYPTVVATSAPPTTSSFPFAPGGRIISEALYNSQPAWELNGDGSGRIGPYAFDLNNMTGLQSCKLVATATQNLAAGWANYTMGAVAWDTQGTMADLANSRIYCRRSGRYVVTATGGYANNATGRRVIGLWKNGSELGERVESPNSSVSATQHAMNINVVIDLVAGDYLTIAGYQNSGGALGSAYPLPVPSITVTELGGMPGPQGPIGPQGLTWKGAWVISTVYAINDVVTYNGSCYRVKVNHTSQVVPSGDPFYYEILAEKGTVTNQDTGWIEVTSFSNSWVNYGSGYETAAYRKLNGVVYLKGLIKTGAMNTAGGAFTMPAGYRPAATQIFTCNTNAITTGAASAGTAHTHAVGSVGGRADIFNTGEVKPVAGNNAHFSLDGINFIPA